MYTIPHCCNKGALKEVMTALTHLIQWENFKVVENGDQSLMHQKDGRKHPQYGHHYLCPKVEHLCWIAWGKHVMHVSVKYCFVIIFCGITMLTPSELCFSLANRRPHHGNYEQWINLRQYKWNKESTTRNEQRWIRRCKWLTKWSNQWSRRFSTK